MIQSESIGRNNDARDGGGKKLDKTNSLSYVSDHVILLLRV